MNTPEIKAARRHAYRLGRQIGLALESVETVDLESLDQLNVAWETFISQFSGDSSYSVIQEYLRVWHETGKHEGEPALDVATGFVGIMDR